MSSYIVKAYNANKPRLDHKRAVSLSNIKHVKKIFSKFSKNSE